MKIRYWNKKKRVFNVEEIDLEKYLIDELSEYYKEEYKANDIEIDYTETAKSFMDEV